MAMTTLISTLLCVTGALFALTDGQEQPGWGNMELDARRKVAKLSKAKLEQDGASLLESSLRFQYPLLFEASFQEKLVSELRAAAVARNISARCEEDLNQLVQDLVAKKPYTFKVLDAVGKPSAGLTQGAVAWLGSYDLCTSIVEYESNRSRNVTFQGRHCLATIKGPFLNLVSPIIAQMGIMVGVCIPNTCDVEDLAPVVNMGLNALLKELKVPISVSNETIYTAGGMCATAAPWKPGDTVALVLVSIIGFLGLCGSLYDVLRRVHAIRRKSAEHPKMLFPETTAENDVAPDDKAELVNNEIGADGTLNVSEDFRTISPRSAAVKGFLHQVLMSFSFIANAEKLLGASMREGQLGAVNGVRVISMWWVILGHTYVFIMTGGTTGAADNAFIMLDVIKRFSFQAIANGTYSVDSFFFLSGLLLAYLLLRELKKTGGTTNWALLYFHRFWRLTPVYMFVLMIFSTLWFHFPEGPMMRAADNSATQCQKYWWTNLLYINNILPRDLKNECMGWAWYLANDMQFFVISPVIIYLLYRYRYIGYAVLTTLILACLITTGVVSRYNKVNPIITAGGQSFQDIYTLPQYRISPYLVGIATGYVLSVWEERGRPRIYKLCVLVGWCLAIAINMSVLYGVYGPIHTNVMWNDDVNALYEATSRFAWSLGLAWVIFACITGYGGPVNRFLSWSVWAPLGRLTYCAYLVHPIVMFNYILSLKTLIHVSDYVMIYLYVGHLVLSYLVAFVVSIAVEAPMLGLEKIIFKKKKD